MPFLSLPCLALPCLALPCLALPCLALACFALGRAGQCRAGQSRATQGSRVGQGVPYVRSIPGTARNTFYFSRMQRRSSRILQTAAAAVTLFLSGTQTGSYHYLSNYRGRVRVREGRFCYDLLVVMSGGEGCALFRKAADPDPAAAAKQPCTMPACSAFSTQQKNRAGRSTRVMRDNSCLEMQRTLWLLLCVLCRSLYLRTGCCS